MLLSLFAVYAQVREWDDPEVNCMIDGVPTLGCLEIVYGNLLFISSILIIFVLFCMYVYGAWTYLTSLGVPESMEKAQGTFKWATIGVVLYISAYVILFTIDFLFLGGEGKIFELNLRVSP